jgi:uncharacterized membrane protein
VTLPTALLPIVVAVATVVVSGLEIVTAALMLRMFAEPAPDTVAVVSISVSSIEVGGAVAGIELPSVVVHDDASPKGSFASVVSSH